VKLLKNEKFLRQLLISGREKRRRKTLSGRVTLKDKKMLHLFFLLLSAFVFLFLFFLLLNAFISAESIRPSQKKKERKISPFNLKYFFLLKTFFI